MRMYVIGALLVFLLYLSVYRPFIQGRKFPAISVSLLAVMVLVTGWQEYRWQEVERMGTEAVKEVSGNKEGYLKCQRFSEAFFDIQTSVGGKVYWKHPNRAIVNYEECHDIRAWIDNGMTDSNLDQIRALHVLTHEAVHVAGERNESITECTAANRNPITVKALGASDEEARIVSETYYKVVLPYMPSEYKLEGCALHPDYDSIAFASSIK